MIVIDASVAVKWYREETGSELAAQVFADNAGTLVAPDLFAVEVCSALVRHANAVKSSRPEMERALRSFSALLSDGIIELRRAGPAQLDHAARIALDLGHPLKDCVYLVLALAIGRPLVTCDARFAARAREVDAQVRVLGE